MAIPANAKKLTEPLDPKDLDKYGLTFKQDGVLLEVGEGIASYTLSLSAEALAAGLIIKQDGGYSTTLVGLGLIMYFEIDPAMRGSSLFLGDGTELPFDILLNTDAALSRRKHKTATLKVQVQ